MKRTEKIALLTKVLQQGDSPANRQQLQRASETAFRPLVIIDDLGSDEGGPMSDSDPVTFHDRGKEHRMSITEAYEYARRYRIRPLIILPAKR